ncbi:hypothetical protein [Rhodobacteraceae phage LS06-2018-MD06]|jgi:hypothetical protein|nr:hypothetical protein [Rhodobacteraceae phage LS06-2018-MD06]
MNRLAYKYAALCRSYAKDAVKYGCEESAIRALYCLAMYLTLLNSRFPNDS